MYPTILHIYGPFALHSFSVFIALGIALFIYKALKHPQLKLLMSSSQFINFILEGTILALIGGRILYCLEEWHSFSSIWEMFYIWNKGLSSLGSIITALIYIFWYTHKHAINMWQICDIISLYAPIIHMCTRIGCFLAGCCYGQPTHMAWAITYSHPDVVAPLHIPLHPTQLYSASIYLVIYILLSRFAYTTMPDYKHWYKPGQITCLYLLLSSIERLSTDFLRGDRIISSRSALIHTQSLSFDQWIAISLCITALIALVYLSYVKRDIHKSALS
jgi:phosphatidylglycerol---prolipoprotein diacylglyceryl transferase